MRDSLSRHHGATPKDDAEIRSMAAAAWHKKGLALLDPAEINDDWTRQVIVNEANKRYGKRKERE